MGAAERKGSLLCVSLAWVFGNVCLSARAVGSGSPSRAAGGHGAASGRLPSKAVCTGGAQACFLFPGNSESSVSQDTDLCRGSLLLNTLF